MSHSGVWLLGVALLLAIPSAASAGTLATPIRFVNADASVSCRVNNVGAKPIVIKAVRVLGNDPGAGTVGIETCTNLPVAPDSTCVFAGTTESGHIGAAIEVKGSGKTLRGLCAVSADGAIVQYLELR